MNRESSKPEDKAIETSLQIPRVVAHFSGYTPPFNPIPIVERMLASVPSKYLIGLEEIVLTNSSGLSRKRRRSVTKARNRKVRIAEARGLYHPEWNNKPAWIEIFVENTLKRYEKRWWTKLSFVREAEISDVLFHEIGHHIHFTIRPEYREQEDVADIWKVRLGRNYLRGRHPILRAILILLRPLTGPAVRNFHRSATERMLVKGAISRAEYNEETRTN